MGRPPRFAPAGLPQHVTQRGNYGQDVFFNDDDRHFYLSLLDRHSAERKVSVIAYTLMTNHVHLILEPQTDDGLSIMMQCVQSEYARSLHTRQDLLGHLWRHHYDAFVMDETTSESASRTSNSTLFAPESQRPPSGENRAIDVDMIL